MLIALLPGAGPAEAGDAPESDMALDVRPLLCIVDRRNPECRMSFRIHWQSGRMGDYCLRNDLAAAPLQCWIEERSGRFNEARLVEETFRYWMSRDARDGAEGEERLAEVTVEVLRADDGDRRRSRRSRHVWDLL